MLSRVTAGATVLASGPTAASHVAPQNNASQGNGTTPQRPGVLAASSTASTRALEKTLRPSVSGEVTAAMVNTITHNGKETGDQMIRQNLPSGQNIVLPTGSELTKVLVLGMSIDGANTVLTCAFDIACEALKESSSPGHTSVECLFLGTGAE